jgi:hypothetical protein
LSACNALVIPLLVDDVMVLFVVAPLRLTVLALVGGGGGTGGGRHLELCDLIFVV